jgi:hypothetical protein
MKILFATDGAKQSDAAIEMLRKFALSDGDEIKVVSVVDMAVPMAIDIYGGFTADISPIPASWKKRPVRTRRNYSNVRLSGSGPCSKERILPFPARYFSDHPKAASSKPPRRFVRILSSSVRMVTADGSGFCSARSPTRSSTTPRAQC